MKISEIDNENKLCLDMQSCNLFEKGIIVSLEEFFKSGDNTRGNLRVFKRITYKLDELTVNTNTIGGKCVQGNSVFPDTTKLMHI